MQLGDLTINQMIAFIGALSVSIVSVQQIFNLAVKILNKFRKKKNKEENLDETVKRHEELINENTQYHKYMGDGIKELLRIILIEKHEYYMLQGFIYVDQLVYYNEMFATYVALGGNFTITQLHEEVATLPVKNR